MRKIAQIEIQTYADILTVSDRAYKNGKLDVLKELIAIWKDRDPLEPFTTNAILLELKVRKRMLKGNKI